MSQSIATYIETQLNTAEPDATRLRQLVTQFELGPQTQDKILNILQNFNDPSHMTASMFEFMQLLLHKSVLKASNDPLKIKVKEILTQCDYLSEKRQDLVPFIRPTFFNLWKAECWLTNKTLRQNIAPENFVYANENTIQKLQKYMEEYKLSSDFLTPEQWAALSKNKLAQSNTWFRKHNVLALTPLVVGSTVAVIKQKGDNGEISIRPAESDLNAQLESWSRENNDQLTVSANRPIKEQLQIGEFVLSRRCALHIMIQEPVDDETSNCQWLVEKGIIQPENFDLHALIKLNSDTSFLQQKSWYHDLHDFNLGLFEALIQLLKSTNVNVRTKSHAIRRVYQFTRQSIDLFSQYITKYQRLDINLASDGYDLIYCLNLLTQISAKYDFDMHEMINLRDNLKQEYIENANMYAQLMNKLPQPYVENTHQMMNKFKTQFAQIDEQLRALQNSIRAIEDDHTQLTKYISATAQRIGQQLTL